MFLMMSVLVSPVGRAVWSSLVLLLVVLLSRNFGIKIGFEMGVLGSKSDNLHPYRVESIDKGLYLEAVSGCNR